MKTEFSVIIPIYNSEDMLSRCIESVLNQTYERFELILVDDGSTDGCGEICDEYAKNDVRICVVHKQNGGVSSARNVGMDRATGEYIVFIDSDDYVEPNYLEAFCDEKTKKFDLIVSGVKVYDPEMAVVFSSDNENICTEQLDQNRIEQFMKNFYAPMATAKRYRAQIIKSNGIRFDEQMSYGEDSLFVVEYMIKSHNLSVIDTPTYNICQRNTPSLSKLSDEKWIPAYSEVQYKIYQCLYQSRYNADFILQKYWWTVGNFIKRTVANQALPLSLRQNLVKRILNQEFVQFCLKNAVSNDENRIYKFLLRHKLISSIVMVNLSKNRWQKEVL